MSLNRFKNKFTNRNLLSSKFLRSDQRESLDFSSLAKLTDETLLKVRSFLFLNVLFKSISYNTLKIRLLGALTDGCW